MPMALSPDLTTIAWSHHQFHRASSGDAMETVIHLLDARSGRKRRTLPDFWEYPVGVAFSADGTQLAVMGGGGLLPPTFIDLARGTKRVICDDERGAAAVFSPNGRGMICYGDKQPARLRSLPEGKLVRVLASHEQPTIARFSADGSLLATGSNDGRVVIWNPTGPIPKQPDLLIKPGSRLDILAFSPDGKLLAAGSRGEIRLWDIQTGRLQRSPLPHSKRDGGATPVWGLAFSSDSTRLAAGGQDVIRIWDLTTGRIRAFSGFSPDLVAFDGTGRTIILAEGTHGTVRHCHLDNWLSRLWR